MSVKYSEIFSEYDITKWGIQFPDDAEATIMDTVGSAEESMEVRTVTKNKRNMPWKTRTKATGAGEVKVTAHIREDVYGQMFGMYVDGYKDGVMAYGTLSVHEQFCMTETVEDEDGNVKLKAYPCCTVKEGISRKVETNAEEIAEVELTISVDPDHDGIGMYQVIVQEDTDESMVESWMKNFDSGLVKVADEATEDGGVSGTEQGNETGI